MQKMSKDIRYVVEQANKLLATPLCQNDSEERYTIHAFISHILMEKNMYHGFNYFIEKDCEGNKILTLACKETSLIQFTIK